MPRATRAARWLALMLLHAGAWPAHADEFREFSSRGLPLSDGVVVRVSHPPAWRRADTDDERAIAELRGPQGPLTGILQIGRGRKRSDIATLCRPERARDLLREPPGGAENTRVTDVVARTHEDRPAYDIRYERSDPPDFLRAHTLLVCLKDSQLVVSCAGMASARMQLPDIDPVCARVLETVRITEE